MWRRRGTEYKVEAAHRVIDSGRTIAEVARELGIDPGMLSVWGKDERRRITAAEVQRGQTPGGRVRRLRRVRRDRRRPLAPARAVRGPGRGGGCRAYRRPATTRT
ncbi:transposase [Streptomyces sp. NPDC050448]|uniref:transposase n=1 Tax=Streptomyces sp. NPDC050448 TaxID=3155404 RepID=UPI00341FE793